MNRKNYMKLSVALPVISGIITGTALFLLGEMDDAPGLCLIGIAAAFLLIMWGIQNAGIIKKSQLAYILPLCFGVGGFVMSIVLKLDGEFEDTPALFFIAVLLSAALVCAGVIKAIKTRKTKKSEK